jgi:hypothetical protein
LISGSDVQPVPILHSESSTFTFDNRHDLSSCDRSVAHNCYGLNDVLNDGRKQGIVKKYWSTEKARSKICRIEIFKSIFHFLKKCEHLNLPQTLKEVMNSENLKYSELKNACRAAVNVEILRNFFPISDIRNQRRQKLDNFFALEGPKNEDKFVKQQAVLLLSGTVGDPKSEDSNDFTQPLRQGGFDARKVPVLKTTFCNQVTQISVILIATNVLYSCSFSMIIFVECHLGCFTGKHREIFGKQPGER